MLRTAKELMTKGSITNTAVGANFMQANSVLLDQSLAVGKDRV
jgi:hypothetical protein